MVAGGVCQTPSYLSCKSETEVKNIFKRQLDVFMKKNVDFLIAEVEPPPRPFPPPPHVNKHSGLNSDVPSFQYFEHVEEAIWAVEVLKATGKPVAASLCIGPQGDMHGVSPGECAVRLVKAGEYEIFDTSKTFKNLFICACCGNCPHIALT